MIKLPIKYLTVFTIVFVLSVAVGGFVSCLSGLESRAYRGTLPNPDTGNHNQIIQQ